MHLNGTSLQNPTKQYSVSMQMPIRTSQRAQSFARLTCSVRQEQPDRNGGGRDYLYAQLVATLERVSKQHKAQMAHNHLE
jgi:hypothetical protein